MSSPEPQPDLVIRGATVVDGTGAAPFVGDVALRGKDIVAVAPHIETRGLEEIDAAGLLLTPGWVDPHTHFDAQYSWDPYLSPSTAAGVTTCIMGNCGIGFAPCQKDRRTFLAHLIEAVEDIPGAVIAEGMTYDFETFEEYLDSIDRKELACDVAVMVGHSAVRTWVMGKRASLSDRPGGAEQNPVQPHEVKAMADLVRDCVAAGAMGFSTSRLLVHRDPDGTLTPGALAGTSELMAITESIAQAGGGVFEMSTDWQTYDDVAASKLDKEEITKYQQVEAEWMVNMARIHGEKVGFTFNVLPVMPVGRKILDQINDAGGIAKGQSFLRVQGFVISAKGRFTPLAASKSYKQLKKQCKQTGSELLVHMQQPQHREKIIQEMMQFFEKQNSNAKQFTSFWSWGGIYPWEPSYEPSKNESIKNIAKREGRQAVEVAYDLMASGGTLWKPQPGLYRGNLDSYREFILHPHIIPGFADGGAHGTMIQDATAASYTLTHWVRDRSAGQLPVELVVKKQTSDVAQLFGLTDRGVIAPGKKADLNLIDLEKLKVREPYIVQDLPLDQERWTQEVEGYRLTLVSGRPIFADGRPTGTLPGRLVRNPRRKADMWEGIAASVSGPFESGLPQQEDLSRHERSLDGAEGKGASAAARVLRNTVEMEEPVPQSRL